MMSAFFVLEPGFSDIASAIAWSSSRTLRSRTERSSCCSPLIEHLACLCNDGCGRGPAGSCQEPGTHRVSGFAIARWKQKGRSVPEVDRDLETTSLTEGFPPVAASQASIYENVSRWRRIPKQQPTVTRA